MLRIVLLIWMMVSLTTVGWTNNVRIVGDVNIVAEDIVNEIATVKFTVEWENSWSDAYNYDGVYLFFKYKLDGGDGRWHHAYLMDGGHSVTSAYEYDMQKSSNIVDRCEGLFIYRKDKTNGSSKVDLELKWKIGSNTDSPLTRDYFITGRVALSAMGMEMVYLPRSAFRAGDTKSDSTFKNKYVTIPPEKDILSDANAKYTYTSSEQVNDSEKGANPPAFAVNRVNSPGATTINAWVGALKTTGNYDWWRVDFDVPKTIYNIAIESVPGKIPTEWALEGTNDGLSWIELYTGDGEDWMTTSLRTYPCTHAIEVTKTDQAFKYFRIRIISTTVAVVIKNVAMTTENILESVDNSVCVSYESIGMNNSVGYGDKLNANDGDVWTGILPITYPNGFPAFWTMKYEISQEQYVVFLNKLTAAQQKTRTTLFDLERLKDSEYVFGSNRNTPTARNGIILAKQGKDGKPHVFANDLNKLNAYSQEGDGQTIACNFLNPTDMLAYADWCGLRPLSELEYEKMARRPYPYAAIWNEYAWNTDDYVVSTALNDLGKGSKTEAPADGYVNAENKIKGPIRCGAYAGDSEIQKDAGASFWGLMELSGNLAEIYYNANSEGRKFHANLGIYHGDGSLAASGHSNMLNTYWPVKESAFALRGGSFASEASELRISDRSRHWGVYTTPNSIYEKRDSTVGFRLGCTAPVLLVNSEIVLQNGMTSADATPIDTICSGDDYLISGILPEGISGFVQIVWFKSEDNGLSWDLIPEEQNPSLKISNMINVNEEVNFLKEYHFLRRIFTNESEYRETRPVAVRVVDNELYISTIRDTVDAYDHSNGVTITTKQLAKFNLYWMRPNSGHRELALEHEFIKDRSYQMVFAYSDFNDGTQVSNREEKVVLKTEIIGRCSYIDTLKVFVMPEPKRQNNLMSNLLTMNPDFKCGDILVDNEAAGNHLEYKTIRIGERCWFAENLRRPTADVTDSKCYNDMKENCEKFGRLYHWNAAVGSWNNSGTVKGICPTGWHIPNDTEWRTLQTDAGGTANLSSQLDPWSWNNETTEKSNTSRFSALPAGAHAQNLRPDWWGRFNGYAFDDILAIWWTANYSTTPSATGYYGSSARHPNVPHTSYIQYNTRANCQNGYYGVGINYIDNNTGLSTVPGAMTSSRYNGWFIERCCYHSINYAFGGDNYHAIYERIHMPVRCVKDGVELPLK